ncbi:MAG: hypothetical protein M3N82_04865 [Pseudomonadota bacterium]|nr:hypothetical protein [Pseudomonadota bacterium]
MKRLLNTIQAVVGGDARVLAKREGAEDHWIDVNWPWPSEDRPHRMSKTLRVVISSELLADFEAAAPNRQKETTERVAAALTAELARFNREHQAPRDQSPPVEVWRITSEWAR